MAVAVLKMTLIVLAGVCVFAGALADRLVDDRAGRWRALAYAGTTTFVFLLAGVLIWAVEPRPLLRAASELGCLLGFAGAFFSLAGVLRRSPAGAEGARPGHGIAAVSTLALALLFIDGATLVCLLRGSDAVKVASVAANLALTSALVLAWHRPSPRRSAAG